MNEFALTPIDYAAFASFFIILSVVGYLAGRKERDSSEDYFLAGKKLPWYVVGGSFVASNISSEHFIGQIGAACMFGVCVALSDWMNVLSFSLLIWLFIPFLLVTRVFTIPEFLQRRFSPFLRQMFAVVTILTNIVAFLAAILYGGALALHDLFGWNMWFAIVTLGIVAGVWAIYGGLSSVAWTDLFTIVVMIIGGTTVTILGLSSLAGENGTLVDGFARVIEYNRAEENPWKTAVERNVQQFSSGDSYDRLSVVQPADHPVQPWPALIFGVFAVSIWYNVLNQFMIQRVLGAKNMYHARMGIVFAGFLKVFMPVITVLPGLILFAMHPEILDQDWSLVKKSADTGYVHMLQTLVPAGLRGLFLAALFGAIQSTVNSVLNSTATIFTLDMYKQWIRRDASDRHLVWVGVATSVVVLAVAIVLGGFINRLDTGGLFVYIQTLYFFFAPPFSAVFILGILWKRANAKGAAAAVVAGFVLGILVKVYLQLPAVPPEWIAACGLEGLYSACIALHPTWLDPYANQGALNWAVCTLICIVVSLATAPPKPEQVSDQLVVNWSRLNIFSELGTAWYNSVVTWWLLFVASIVLLVIVFSGAWL